MPTRLNRLLGEREWVPSERSDVDGASREPPPSSPEIILHESLTPPPRAESVAEAFEELCLAGSAGLAARGDLGVLAISDPWLFSSSVRGRLTRLRAYSRSLYIDSTARATPFS